MSTTASRKGTALLVWAADPCEPQRCATLFVTAQACCALDLEVEMYFTGPAVRMLLKDSQATVIGYGDEARPLGHHLRETLRAGTRLLACSQALHHLDIAPSALIDGAGYGGVVQFAARCADPAWNTLVF